MHAVRWINIHGDFDYWTVGDNKHGLRLRCARKAPTHWMPLPEPPETTPEQRTPPRGPADGIGLAIASRATAAPVTG